MANICKECADPSWSGQAPIVVPRLPVDGKVLEFDTFDDFPTKGESGFIYVDLENNDFYKWDTEGEQYASIGGSSAERDYEKLNHLPAVNGVTLVGDKSTADLGIADEIDTAVAAEATARDAAIAVEAAARDAAISAEATARDTAIAAEAATRAAADLALQTQIDGITSASDVVDVVGTYADLEDYDTSKLHDNDIIKVLQDETHNDAITYYRWIVADEAFTYIGLQGPFYTKSETNTLLGEKQDTLTAGENVTIDENGVISAASTYVTITVTPDMIISEEPITFQFTETEDAIITNAQNMLIKIDATQVGIGATIFTKSVSNRAGEYVLTNNIATYTASAMTVSDSTANMVVYRHSDMKAVYSVKDLLDEDDITQTTGQSETLLMSQKAITDALADAGGVKELTEDDYNWNSQTKSTSNPNCVALWLLDDGVYTRTLSLGPASGVPVVSSASVSQPSTDDFDTQPVIIVTHPATNFVHIFGLGNGQNWTKNFSGRNLVIFKQVETSGVEGLFTSTIVEGQIVDNLTSNNAGLVLSAKQGKVLKDLIDALPAAPTVVQAVGTSTTDVMSQNAVSGLLFGKTGSNYSNEKLCIGKSSNNLQQNGSAEFGISSDTNAAGQISFPYGRMSELNINKAGVFNIGVFNKSFGYDGSSNYRLLTGVHDPVSDHDAATKGYVDAHGGPTVVQTTGTSTTDVMSQDAVTKTLFTSTNDTTVRIGNTGYTGSECVCIGNGSQAGGTSVNRATVVGAGGAEGVASYGGAFGYAARGAAYSVALGSYSRCDSVQGVVSIGGSALGANGYNGTSYRLLTNVYDPQSDHDAATKGYVDANAGAEINSTDWSNLWQ